MLFCSIWLCHSHSTFYIWVWTFSKSQTTGYAIQHILCLSQARINWEVCGRKAIRRKNGGLMEVAYWLVRMEWRPPVLSLCLPFVILPITIKVQKLSSGTGSPGWSRKTGRKMVVVWCNVWTFLKWITLLSVHCWISCSDCKPVNQCFDWCSALRSLWKTCFLIIISVSRLNLTE